MKLHEADEQGELTPVTRLSFELALTYFVMKSQYHEALICTDPVLENEDSEQTLKADVLITGPSRPAGKSEQRSRDFGFRDRNPNLKLLNSSET